MICLFGQLQTAPSAASQTSTTCPFAQPGPACFRCSRQHRPSLTPTTRRSVPPSFSPLNSIPFGELAAATSVASHVEPQRTCPFAQLSRFRRYAEQSRLDVHRSSLTRRLAGPNDRPSEIDSHALPLANAELTLVSVGRASRDDPQSQPSVPSPSSIRFPRAPPCQCGARFGVRGSNPESTRGLCGTTTKRFGLLSFRSAQSDFPPASAR
jgi:hypothetical protein